MSKNIKNKTVHQVHDKGYKDLFSRVDIALDFFKNTINQKWSKNLTTKDLERLDKSFITNEYKNIESDLIYKANIDGQDAFLYILLEFQSSIDYRMPVRLLFYMSELIKSYTDSNFDDYNQKDKQFLIPPIVPIVLYNGKDKWEVPTEFRKVIKNENLFDDSLLNFKYLLFDINRLNSEELMNNKNISSIIFLLDQKMTVEDFIDKIKSIKPTYDKFTDAEKEGILSWLSNSFDANLSKIVVNMLKEEGEKMTFNNANILTEYGIERKNEGKKEFLLELLEELGNITENIKEKIQNQDDMTMLKKWARIAMKCESIEEFENKIQ